MLQSCEGIAAFSASDTLREVAYDDQSGNKRDGTLIQWFELKLVGRRIGEKKPWLRTVAFNRG
jgi:hypothetical protein